MFTQLTSLGWGIVTFSIIVGVGALVITKLGDSVASCNSSVGMHYNSTARTCYLTNGTPASDPLNSGWSNLNYMNTQLGSTSGLASYVPLIIIIAIAGLLLGGFLVQGGKRKA